MILRISSMSRSFSSWRETEDSTNVAAHALRRHIKEMGYDKGFLRESTSIRSSERSVHEKNQIAEMIYLAGFSERAAVSFPHSEVLSYLILPSFPSNSEEWDSLKRVIAEKTTRHSCSVGTIIVDMQHQLLVARFRASREESFHQRLESVIDEPHNSKRHTLRSSRDGVTLPAIPENGEHALWTRLSDSQAQANFHRTKSICD
jgi:hypothetical protein